MKATKSLVATMAAVMLVSCSSREELSKGEVQAIAEEAFIYAFPMIMAYGIMYEYSVDKTSGQYKGPFNTVVNESRVYTPQDTAVVTPNSDTPYSFVMMDLRAEPMVLCVPKIDKNRYYSIQLVSQYTFNFAYIGSRATGNSAGCYGVAGPHWHGALPARLKKMYRSETDFAVALYRTQLFNPADMPNVKKIQSGYTAQPLSQFMHRPTPKPAAKVEWPAINKKLVAENPFSYLNFLLQFAPSTGTAAIEKPLRIRFAKIGIEPGKPFLIDALSSDRKEALDAGIKSGMDKIIQQAGSVGKNENGWRVVIGAFGSRATLNNNWILRAAAAKAGIYGNDAAEALYPLGRVDSNNRLLDGSKHNYTLTFPAGQLPPVNAFWSVTMYDGKTQLLINNSINRYLINSPMLPSLKKNADGSLTLYIQKNSPGKEKESNWLPAPDGPIYLVMRLYWPKDAALKGAWKPPAIIASTSPVAVTKAPIHIFV